MVNIIAIKNLAAGVMLLASTQTQNPALPVNVPSIAPQNDLVAVQYAPDALDRWIDKLAIKESEGKTHIKILDHNNRYSYGCLQFQMETFKAYTARYDMLKGASDNDFEESIYDCDLQKSLARKMIEEDYGNWRHWYTSVAIKNLGYPPKIDRGLNTLAEK